MNIYDKNTLKISKIYEIPLNILKLPKHILTLKNYQNNPETPKNYWDILKTKKNDWNDLKTQKMTEIPSKPKK